MAIGDDNNVQWVDGLRGVSSALVVIKHLVLAWFIPLVWPSSSAEASPNFLQLPIIRILIQGRIGVAGFCLVTGYVSALKPIKLINQGNHNQAYASMTRSAVRRIPRLLLPISLIVTLSCIATQLGAFNVANHCDGLGLPDTSPNQRATLGETINAWLHDLASVWTHGHSEYGSELWTMVPILKGAYWIYVFLVTTASIEQRYRMMAALLMTLYRAACNDPYFGMQFFFGAFLADLQNLEPSTFPRLQSLSSLTRLRAAVSTACILTGLFIGSLPDDNYEWQAWSAGLRRFLLAILPADPDLPRFASGLGLQVIAVGLHLSPGARNVLSNRFFRWLGRMSFAVYLLHNQILRSVMCWMIYGFSIPNEGEPPLAFTNKLRFFMALPFYIGITYGSAHLWTAYVDSYCARLSERIVNYVKVDNSEKSQRQNLPY